VNDSVIRPALTEDLDALAELFDGYRRFYEQPSNIDLARDYLHERMSRDESMIFVCESEDGSLLGFVQLYPTFCSVEARPILVLYDLFVTETARRGGVGRALMEAAQAYGREQGVARLDLSTAVDNLAGQALYESLGWERDADFYHYSYDV
jgi:ribosomal protein S18 acetylase RimI-like enzyme